ncbi:MAG: rhodanese-like domain-containing protein, partial [Bacilli bacterium]
MFVDVTYEEARQRQDVAWIDVRSESEHRESTIPHAVSVPLFNDEERARIGTVYKQESPQAAQALGLAIASAKLPILIERINAAAAGRIPVVFCWRGGMRSKTVATVIDLLGVEAWRLQGGYR